MCGRFARFSPAHIYRLLFQLDQFMDITPQYNISPGQNVYAVRGIVLREEQEKKAPNNFQKELASLKWGLIPFWSKNPEIGVRMINSRSESIAEKPAFREPFKKRRCLIPADGFYEWQKTKEGGKQPFFIHMKDNKPFAFGGIWDKWESPEGEIIESCSILTTEANATVKSIHERMPVIIDPANFSIWLNPSLKELDELKQFLKPSKDSTIEAYPISNYVNSPANEGNQCITRIDEKIKQQKLF